MVKEYKKLDKTQQYDKEVVTELAQAHQEIGDLYRRIRLLEEVVSEHRDLEQFLWNSSDGRVIPIFNLEDDHLKNIMDHLLVSGRKISPAIKAEARKRGIEVPTTGMKFIESRQRKDVFDF